MPNEQLLAPEEYLNSGEAMTTVHISRRTLDRYVASGKLAADYLPSGHRRFRRTDVLSLLTPIAPAEPVSPEATGSTGAVLRSPAP